MIPASYLFKPVYHQAWEEPDPLPPPVATPSRGRGILRPLLERLSTVQLPVPHHRLPGQGHGHAWQ